MFRGILRQSTLIAALINAVLLPLAVTALGQARLIKGTVTTSNGELVTNAAIEVTRLSGFDLDQVRLRTGRSQTFQASTNENGEYLVPVPSVGVYLVTASKANIGTDEIEFVVQVDRITTANLTLSKAATAGMPAAECGNRIAIGEFAESDLTANTKNPELIRLLRWLEAVQWHTPGCADHPAMEVGSWSQQDLDKLSSGLKQLREQMNRRGPSGQPPALIQLYDRRFARERSRTSFTAMRRCVGALCYTPTSPRSCRAISYEASASMMAGKRAAGGLERCTGRWGG
jgi:hypothetical protein